MGCQKCQHKRVPCKHRCEYLDSNGKKCSRSKGRHEKSCDLKRCSESGCLNHANFKSGFCKSHSCQWKGCEGSVRVGGEQIYCSELHECFKPACQEIRKRNTTSTDREHTFRLYCKDHYCEHESCTECRVETEGKLHCNAHYCQEETCSDECLAFLSGSSNQRCLPHYEKKIEEKGIERGVAEEHNRHQGEDVRLRRELARLREDNQRIREEGRQQGITEERTRFQEERARLQQELTRLRENNLRIKEQGREEGIGQERARLSGELTRLQQVNQTIKEEGRRPGVADERARLQEEHVRLQEELTRLQKELGRVPRRFRREGLYPDHGYASQPDSESDFRYRDD